MKVNFNERYQPGNQLRYIENALISEHLASDGKYAARSGKILGRRLNSEGVLLTTSATAALELALSLLHLRPGDEVILPSYNFPSAANAVLRCGGQPILCDIEGATKNLDPESVIAHITKKTRAVIPAHYGGISCEMDQLVRLASENNLVIIEDAAQALFSSYHNVPLGTIGKYGVYSFHYTKNFSCGEGGAFLCKTQETLLEAEEIRDNGTDRARFFRNESKFYSWTRPGTNHVLSEACSALLYPQLLEAKKILSRRKAIAEIYQNAFKQASDTISQKLQPMKIPFFMEPNYHTFYVDCVNIHDRESLRHFLLQEGIDARSHYIPLHLSVYGKALGYLPAQFPMSTSAAERILRLPLHTQMTEKDAEFIAERVICWAKKR